MTPANQTDVVHSLRSLLVRPGPGPTCSANSGLGQIALCDSRLVDLRQQPLTRCLQNVPTLAFLQWRNGHRLAAVETDQRGLDQITHLDRKSTRLNSSH